MKKTLIAGLVAATIGTSALAGGLTAPVMEAPIIVEETTANTSSSSAGLIIPLILLALIAAAMSSNRTPAP